MLGKLAEQGYRTTLSSLAIGSTIVRNSGRRGCGAAPGTPPAWSGERRNRHGSRRANSAEGAYTAACARGSVGWRLERALTRSWDSGVSWANSAWRGFDYEIIREVVARLAGEFGVDRGQRGVVSTYPKAGLYQPYLNSNHAYLKVRNP